MKRIAVVIVAVLIATGLSACDQFIPDPLAYTLVDGQPVVRICVPLTITQQRISHNSGNGPTEFEVVWSSSGLAELPVGAELALGGPVEGLTIDTPDAVDLFDEIFRFEMEVSNEEGGEWSTFAFFQPGEIKEGEWSDGQEGELAAPCTHEECVQFAACHNNWPQPSGDATRSEPTFVPSPLPTGQN